MSDKGVILGAAALAAALLLLGAVLGRTLAHPAGSPGPVSVATASPVEHGNAGSDAVAALASAPGVSGNAAGAAGEERARRPGSSPEQTRPSGDRLPSELVRRAADRAPFQPDRQRPAVPYRMPGDPADPPPPPPPPEPTPPPEFQVLGTIVEGNGGVAIVQLEDGRPVVLSAGERLAGYTLAQVGEGRVTMAGEGRSLTLAVADPQTTAPVADEDGRGRSERSSRPDRQQMEQIEQLRARALEMARQLGERTGGQVRVEMDGNRVMIIGPDGQRREMRAGPQQGGGPGFIVDGVRLRGQIQEVRPQQRRPPGGGR